MVISGAHCIPGSVGKLQFDMLMRVTLLMQDGGSQTTEAHGQSMRPRRSSFQTMSVSPSSNALRKRSSAGRLVVAPDKPSSLKSVLHPARFKVASCKAVLWSSVDTRA